MIDRLLRGIIDAGADIGSAELAEILWLAKRIDSPPNSEFSSAAAQPNGDPGLRLVDDAPHNSESTAPSMAPVYPAHRGERITKSSSGTGVRVRVRRANSLDDPLAVMRALRPLGRRPTSAGLVLDLDEEATVEASIDQQMLVPVLSPASGRWLNLALVIDTHHSMLLWHDLVRELCRTIVDTGLFRTVQTWHLHLPDSETSAHVTRTRGGMLRSPHEVIDPTGSQLILVLSDTMGDSWSTPALHDVIRKWGAHSSVAIINPLPERLWNRGAIHPTVRLVRASTPAAPNTAWDLMSPPARRRLRHHRQIMGIPIVDTTPSVLADLAYLIAGDGTSHRITCLLINTTKTADPPTDIASDEARILAVTNKVGVDAIRDFNEKASPTARELAAYLSVMPLTLPVMNLVRAVMLPGADHGHLAEVALSSLIEPWEHSSTIDPEQLELRFRAGVREALLGSLLEDDIVRVKDLVETRLSAYIARRPGSAGDFPAIQLVDRESGDHSIVADSMNFAKMGVNARPAESPSDIEDHSEIAGLVYMNSGVSGSSHLESESYASATPYWIQGFRIEDFPYRQIPPAVEVSDLLSPYQKWLPFVGREVEIEALLRWRDNEDVPDFSAQLVSGAQGVGKTRLAIEFSERCLNDGWKTWRLKSDRSKLDTSLLPSELSGSIMLVIDGVESIHTSKLRELFAVVSHMGNIVQPRRARLRVLLLSGGRQGWWIKARKRLQDSLLRRALDRTPELRLPPLRVDAKSRVNLLNIAMDRFPGDLAFDADAAVGREPLALDMLPRLVNTPAEIQAAAISALQMQNREVRLFSDRGLALALISAKGNGGNAEPSSVLRTGVVLAEGLILTPFLPNVDSALIQVYEIAPRRVGWVAARIVWQNSSLRAAILSVDSDISIGIAIPRVNRDVRYRFATVVTEHIDRDRGKSALPELLQGEITRLPGGQWSIYSFLGVKAPGAGEWLMGALVLEKEAPIGIITAKDASGTFTVTALDDVLNAPGFSTVTSRHRALVSAARTSPARTPDTAHSETLAARRQQADSHRAAGRFAEAARLYEGALAESKRILGPRNSDTLAVRLGLTSAYLAMGRDADGEALEAETEESLSLAIETVVGYRQLVADDQSDRFLPDLAMCLDLLGSQLGVVGRPQEALGAVSEAVEIYRRLVDGEPDVYLPQLAGSLNNLGSQLGVVGRPQEALGAVSEVVEIYRRLVDGEPDVYLPQLAGSLNNLGSQLGVVGRPQEALGAVSEVVEIYRRLVDGEPDVYLPQLAGSLNNLGSRLGVLGRWEEALGEAAQAVEILRRLANISPDAFLPSLADCVSSMANWLDQTGRREEALAAATEAVEIFRPLTSQYPETFGQKAKQAERVLRLLRSSQDDVDRHHQGRASRAGQGVAARVVCVHGIGQQVSGGELARHDWLLALNTGLVSAGADRLTDIEVVMGFYGDLFRPVSKSYAASDVWYEADDVESGFERDLLTKWWHAAASADPGVLPDDRSLTGRLSVQAMLGQLLKSRFFSGVAMRAMVGDLKQFRRYLTEPILRERVRARVRGQITPDTRVMVAHSLGSIVAYETLCASPGHPVRALVTLGSPLGIPGLIFDRLEPTPAGGVGAWPGSDGLVWTNITDAGDTVALVKKLDPLFGTPFSRRVRDVTVHNGAKAHEVSAYLADKLAGQAVAEGLRGVSSDW